jgi:hypothetical protein
MAFESSAATMVEAVDGILPRDSALVGFLRHSPQAMHEHFDKLCQWRAQKESEESKELENSKLPSASPYVGSQRHAPPSPVLRFTNPQTRSQGSQDAFFMPPLLELASSSGDSFFSEDEDVMEIASLTLHHLPEEVWINFVSLMIEVAGIGLLARVARGVSSILKSELVWENRQVVVSPASVVHLAPMLSSWLPAWKLANKLVVPRSSQLLSELSRQAPEIPIEVAWRFDQMFKGNGVEVINSGRTVKRLQGAEEELVVLGDAPLPQTIPTDGHGDRCPFFEVTLEDRSVESEDTVNDFGIGITACPPCDMEELGAVADEVPSSWVIDFAKSSVMLSINNSEVAKACHVSYLKEGDRVALRITAIGSIEIFINGILHEHFIPPNEKRVPRGVALYPVLDLYGCTMQLSRTDAEEPRCS